MFARVELFRSKKGVFFREKCVFLRVYGRRPSFFCKKCYLNLANMKKK